MAREFTGVDGIHLGNSLLARAVGAVALGTVLYVVAKSIVDDLMEEITAGLV